jgi:hypothetical protein
LREIKLDGIAFPFPEMRQVLLSTNYLLELHLVNITNDAYFSPDELVAGLATLVHLERLMVGFHSPASSPPPSTRRPWRRPPPKCITLPSLTFFSFHGTSEYLKDFVDKIDLPSLHTIIIKLFNQIFFEIPQFYQFIRRLNALGSPTEVIVQHRAGSVSVSFQEWKTTSGGCLFVTSCRRFDWQLSFAAQMSSQLSPLFPSVRTLTIDMDSELPTGEEDVDSTQWLELFQLFTHATQLRVAAIELVPGVVQALASEILTTEVLPELTSLFLSDYNKSPSPVWRL